MPSQVSNTPVEAPASKVWKVFGSLELVDLINELLPETVGTVKVLDGDGGAGTVLKVTLGQGAPAPGNWIEVFTKVDDEKRVKETRPIEGELMAMGFNHYVMRWEILEHDFESSIIRGTVEYELKDDPSELASHLISAHFIGSIGTIAQTVGAYIAAH